MKLHTKADESPRLRDEVTELRAHGQHLRFRWSNRQRQDGKKEERLRVSRLSEREVK